MHRFTQHAGGLFIPSIVLGELYAWAYHRDSPQPILDRIQNDLLADVGVLSYDDASAREFGRVRGGLMRQGLTVGPVDLMMASVALANNLTLVTHDTRDHQYVPGLRLKDLLQP